MHFEREYSKRAHIIRFRDGDTVLAFVQCEHCNGIHKEVIRIKNIDSWEPSGKDTTKAKAVADTLTTRFRGVIGVLIPNKERRDKYGRLIADMLINGELLSNLIVNSGLAWYGVGADAPADQPRPTLN